MSKLVSDRQIELQAVTFAARFASHPDGGD